MTIPVARELRSCLPGNVAAVGVFVNHSVRRSSKRCGRLGSISSSYTAMSPRSSQPVSPHCRSFGSTGSRNPIDRASNRTLQHCGPWACVRGRAWSMPGTSTSTAERTDRSLDRLAELAHRLASTHSGRRTDHRERGYRNRDSATVWSRYRQRSGICEGTQRPRTRPGIHRSLPSLPVAEFVRILPSCSTLGPNHCPFPMPRPQYPTAAPSLRGSVAPCSVPFSESIRIP